MKKYFIIAWVIVMILALSACGGNDNNSNAPDTKETEADVNATYTISVAGLDLKYPKMWEDKVTVETLSDRANFSCGDIKLFDIVFNDQEGTVLGTVCGDENVVISIVDYEIDAKNIEALKMQEDVNVIIDNINKDYNFIEGKAIDDTTFDITTDIATLKYPAKWKDKVRIEVGEDSVKFSNDGTPLFDLVFSECDGYLLGTYKDTPIYIIDYPVEGDERLEMQEDVNVILEHLMEDPDFTINN